VDFYQAKIANVGNQDVWVNFQAAPSGSALEVFAEPITPALMEEIGQAEEVIQKATLVDNHIGKRIEQLQLSRDQVIKKARAMRARFTADSESAPEGEAAEPELRARDFAHFMQLTSSLRRQYQFLSRVKNLFLEEDDEISALLGGTAEVIDVCKDIMEELPPSMRATASEIATTLPQADNGLDDHIDISKSFDRAHGIKDMLTLEVTMFHAVNGERVERPRNLSPKHRWNLSYTIKEIDRVQGVHRYRQLLKNKYYRDYDIRVGLKHYEGNFMSQLKQKSLQGKAFAEDMKKLGSRGPMMFESHYGSYFGIEDDSAGENSPGSP
jgi:hypothetical protein